MEAKYNYSESCEVIIENYKNKKHDVLVFLTNQCHAGDIRNIQSVPKQETSNLNDTAKNINHNK